MTTNEPKKETREEMYYQAGKEEGRREEREQIIFSLSEWTAQGGMEDKASCDALSQKLKELQGYDLTV